MKLGFSFDVLVNINGTGSFESIQVFHQNKGLPQEIIITVVKNWLNAYEADYYDKFKKANGF